MSERDMDKCKIPTLLVAACFSTLALAAAPPQLVVIDVTQSKAKPGVTTAYGESEWNFNRVIAADLEYALRSRGFATRIVIADGNSPGDFSIADRIKQFSDASLVISVGGDPMPGHFNKFWSVSGHRTVYVDRFSGYAVSVSRYAQSPKSLLCGIAIATALRLSGYHSSDHRPEMIVVGDRSTAIADADGPVYFDDSYPVLKQSPVPILLFESGVLQNPNDETLLKQSSYRRKLLSKVVAGVVGCLED